MPNPPICETLHLDQRKLPAEVFERISRRAGRYKEREERARQAWENFGKPGRDPQTVGNIFNVIATQGSWTPHLKIRADAESLGSGGRRRKRRATPTPSTCATAF